MYNLLKIKLHPCTLSNKNHAPMRLYIMVDKMLCPNTGTYSVKV